MPLGDLGQLSGVIGGEIIWSKFLIQINLFRGFITKIQDTFTSELGVKIENFSFYSHFSKFYLVIF